MIRLNSEWTRKRWGAGSLLVLAVAALLAVPLFSHGGLDHPLRASQALDLCPLLPAPPASLAVLREAPQSSETGAATCFYFGVTGQPVLSVRLTSTRQMSREVPTRTDKAFAVWMGEIRASYGRNGEVEGNWARAGSWRAGRQESLLFEDRGVLVLVESVGLDAVALAGHARLVQEVLRHPPPQ